MKKRFFIRSLANTKKQKMHGKLRCLRQTAICFLLSCIIGATTLVLVVGTKAIGSEIEQEWHKVVSMMSLWIGTCATGIIVFVWVLRKASLGPFAEVDAGGGGGYHCTLCGICNN